MSKEAMFVLSIATVSFAPVSSSSSLITHSNDARKSL